MLRSIKFEKRSKTKTSNNSYDIIFKNNSQKRVIGSYNQSNNKLMLDLWNFIVLYSSGVKCSSIFTKTLTKISGHFSTKKNIKIKY